MDLGEVIRLRRTKLGMSQADLATAAGVDARQIRRYEAGGQQPFHCGRGHRRSPPRPARRVGQAVGGTRSRSGLGVRPPVRLGIEFSAWDDSNGELWVTGDTAAVLL